MFHFNWRVNTRGLTCCLLGRACAADLLPLTPLFSPSFVFNPEGNECITANAKHCGECIQAGAKCGWCKDPVCEGKLLLFQHIQTFVHLKWILISVLLLVGFPEAGRGGVDPLWRAAVSDKKGLPCGHDRKPKWGKEDPQEQTGNKSQKRGRESESARNHPDPTPETPPHPSIGWGNFQPIFSVALINRDHLLRRYLFWLNNNVFRGAPDIWPEVQTSRRLPDWPLLPDGPVVLNEGWSGECEEPGNQSDAGDVKDHFWLQHRWGLRTWWHRKVVITVLVFMSGC